MARQTRAETLMKHLAETPCWFYDYVTEQFHYIRPVDVFVGEAEVNKQIRENGFLFVDDWASILHGRHTVVKPECGWHETCMLENGTDWIEFSHYCNSDDTHGPFFEIVPHPLPCDGFMDCRC